MNEKPQSSDSQETPRKRSRPLDILHISIHGLIRAEQLELGKDPDTGGQVLYVLELVKALAKDPRVGRVSLLTRRILDPRQSADYARHREPLCEKAEIIRIDAGPRRYLRKEVLWRHLDAFIDGTLASLRREQRVPDLIHAHYADAGYVGRQIAAVLGCPFLFTGHSLGRVKRQRLVEGGAEATDIEKRYNLSTRIEAEEQSLEAASFVCTSTRQEIDQQYALYHNHSAARMRVIPPGVELERFDATPPEAMMREIDDKIGHFLTDPGRPAVLTIARADERKNLPGLVRAFAKNEWLRKNANLILIAGNRETIDKLSPGARKVWLELLRAIDDGDLHGITAYPKRHSAPEVAGFYRWAADRKGLFVNPAFTEPFGLTLLEASAAGLPLVTTNDGGPRDIIANCNNGILIDPLDETAMGHAMEEILSSEKRQHELSETGYHAVREHYSWTAHVDRYLDEVLKILPEDVHVRRDSGARRALVDREHWVVMDLPPHLEEEPPELIERWRDLFTSKGLGLGFATGLSFDEAWQVIHRLKLPKPGFMISSLGSEIRYGEDGVKDERWPRQISLRWKRDRLVEVLADFPGLTMQDEAYQHRFKISYLLDEAEGPNRTKLQRKLREAGLAAKVIVTANAFVDVVPIRSGKDVALRYIEHRWGIDPERIYYFGTYANDAAALRGRNLAAVAKDADRACRQIRTRPRLFHCQQSGLAALFEGLEHYDFLKAPPPRGADALHEASDERVKASELHP